MLNELQMKYGNFKENIKREEYIEFITELDNNANNFVKFLPINILAGRSERRDEVNEIGMNLFMMSDKDYEHFKQYLVLSELDRQELINSLNNQTDKLGKENVVMSSFILSPDNDIYATRKNDSGGTFTVQLNKRNALYSLDFDLEEDGYNVLLRDNNDGISQDQFERLFLYCGLRKKLVNYCMNLKQIGNNFPHSKNIYFNPIILDDKFIKRLSDFYLYYASTIEDDKRTKNRLIKNLILFAEQMTEFSNKKFNKRVKINYMECIEEMFIKYDLYKEFKQNIMKSALKK